MRQWMPEDHGWVDRGPRRLTTLDEEPGRLPAVWPSDDREVREVEQQGRKNPRRLSLEESRTARRNREEARDEAIYLERLLGDRARDEVRFRW